MIATDQVLIAPIVTEKSVEHPNKTAFKVHNDATTADVKIAVKEFYKVDVVKVNMINLPAKTRSAGRRTVQRRAKYRKAIVTLKDGQSLNFNDFK